LKNEHPEIEDICRIFADFSPRLVTFEEQKFMEKTAFSDFSLFNIFSFPFVYGNKGEDSDPNRIVLTETSAQKYFGKVNPVGKVVRLDDRLNMTVVGVIKDIPNNSSIKFDAVIPLKKLKTYYSNPDFLTAWYNDAFTTYGLLYDPASFNKMASSITRRIQKDLPESNNYLRTFKFEDNYLYEQNHIRNIRIYSLIALLVLLTAILNFINLSTARSLKQARETGLRKTIGATRMNLIRLVYSDVAIVCLFAFAMAIGIALLGLPLFNQAIEKEISPMILFSFVPIAVLGIVYLLTVALAGSYPAFFLSSFSPGQTLSSNFQSVKSRSLFRNSLVVIVLTVSIVLLASTLIISQQTRFLQKMDLGFEKDQLMYIDLRGKMKVQAEALKEEISRSSDVLSAVFTSHLPNEIGWSSQGFSWEGKDSDFKPVVTIWGTDENLLKTFGIDMIEGNYFSKGQEGIVINKTFADMIGWDSFTGKTLNFGEPLRILGVINDIHFDKLSEKTKPLFIQQIKGQWGNYLILKVNTGHIERTLSFIRKTCQTIEPSFPLEYAFLNDKYNKMLASEMNMKKLVGIFSAFAMIVLCLGLLGVVMFLTEQKTKEIGIRKCMGEDVISIIRHFIKPFLVSGAVAGVIAMPLTWHLMNRWLQSYANHIQLNLWVFLLSGLIVIGVAVLTVFWQSYKAATRNPVEALRCE
jgi:putative ABC transport system permease protein